MRTLLAITPRRAALPTRRPIPRARPWLLAVVALAPALLVAPASAGAEPNLGNSQAAQACQKGGYKNFVRADGTPFANTGECATYAAQGGVFLAVADLPDLRVDVACSTITEPFPFVRCIITATNVGTVPVTAPVVLRAEMILLTSAKLTRFGLNLEMDGCDPREQAGGTDFNDAGQLYGELESTCGGTVLPGEEVSSLSFELGTESPGVPFTIKAAVDPYNTIIESDEANNTYEASGTTP